MLNPYSDLPFPQVADAWPNSLADLCEWLRKNRRIWQIDCCCIKPLVLFSCGSVTGDLSGKSDPVCIAFGRVEGFQGETYEIYDSCFCATDGCFEFYKDGFTVLPLQSRKLTRFLYREPPIQSLLREHGFYPA